MAIYHLHVKVIGRKSGSSAVASAAYRAGMRLRDERLDRSHDFSAKRGVVHSEVMLPKNAPEALSDRERLWNDVEAFEVRKDAQLAREVEFAIPREMTQAQGVELARDFAQSEFVDRGMIADLNVHWDMAEDGMPKPHVHVMLTMRAVDESGFGQKAREWNRTEMVERWRERWAELANERLAELDIDARIDHRSLEAQGIALEPQSQIGAPAKRIEVRGIESKGLEADRAEMHREIARGRRRPVPVMISTRCSVSEPSSRIGVCLSLSLSLRLSLNMARPRDDSVHEIFLTHQISPQRVIPG
jgi:ATP-dependent exoDNAse (exonuclease V) alpha subunit